MLRYHEIIRPTIPDSFFEQSVDLWLGHATGHMGPQMYKHHGGMRDGLPMSGVSTWNNHARHGTIPRQSKKAFLADVGRVAMRVGKGLPIVEFGPGSMDDAKVLIDALSSSHYIPVDCNLDVIKESRALSSKLKNCLISPAVNDFFSRDNYPLVDRPAMGVCLGLTISNISGPVPAKEPRNQLVNAFRNLTRALPVGGYLLVSADVCQDGERNVALYSEPWHRLFSVNHLYRMAEELPMRGFDPGGFDYLPQWHPQCSLVAHTVVAKKDQEFHMGDDGEIRIAVEAGEVFHYNNSFKYRPEFFENCAEDAGLDLMQYWQNRTTIRHYLFHVPVRDARNSYITPMLSQADDLARRREANRFHG